MKANHLLVALAMVWASCDKGPLHEPSPGDTAFVSADSQRDASPPPSGGDEAGAPGEGEDSNGGRTVEEGDIYRVLGDHRILNLNSYRGVQVIDLSDVQHPAVIGRAAVQGYPVEMYVVDTLAVVLLNNYQAYSCGGVADLSSVEPYYGGLVVTVDLADPTAPRIVDQAKVPGNIQTSRLTRGGGKQALFVAATGYANGTTETYVRSFAVGTDGQLTERSTIDLGGYVIDIQATTEALLVARTDWSLDHGRSTVSLIDIRDPEGAMIEGGEVQTAGMVQHKSNLSLWNGVLRVASSANWSGSNENHLETWNAADLANPIPVDHETFAPGEQLYATIFLGNKAFIVTYLRVDPFHAFWIDDQGQVTARTEYVISGWNDFFKAVVGDTRLIGVGVDDAQGSAMAVSLYDTDLENATPFIARATVDAGSSWSEARWDDRAFSVLEDAVSAPGPNGVTETGLVLLPFSGYDQSRSTYVAGVQIFTFSAQSLTRRGLMENSNWVRRSFRAGETTANLSDVDLALFDTRDVDHPVALGKVELAPNYTDTLRYGSFLTRLKASGDYYWWWGRQTDLPPDELEIVPLAADPDTAAPVATAKIPSGSRVYQVGGLAVAVRGRWLSDSSGKSRYETEIQVIDLSDPATPARRGGLVTDALPYSYPFGGGMPGLPGGAEDCFDCGMRPWYSGNFETAYALGESLVFPATIWESEVIGHERVCNTYPVNGDACKEESSECVMIYGGITCRSQNGEPEVCAGEIQRCTWSSDGTSYTCVPVDPASIEVRTDCWEQDLYRSWSHLELHAVDLSDPDNLRLVPALVLPTEEEFVGLLADGADLLLSYKTPYDVPGDSRSFVRYFFKRISYANPAAPAVGPAINVPGQLMAVLGERVITEDFRYGEHSVEVALNLLDIQGDQASLLARVLFPDHQVNTVALDGAGHLLVSHRLSWNAIDQNSNIDWSQIKEILTVLDVEGDALQKLSEVELAPWASLRRATAGRALYEVSGGILVVNLDDPTHPFPQAYFPVLGWPYSLLVVDDDLIFPAGRYGIYRFAL